MSALVTGGSGHLGRAVCAGLAAQGHDVAVHWRTDGAGADRAVAAVTAAGRRGRRVRCDLTDPQHLATGYRGLLDDVETDLGPLQVAVLAAADQRLTPWPTVTPADWEAVWRGTVTSVAVLVHEIGRRMADRGRGVIVTVGSIEGLRPAPGHAPYAVGKAAVHQLTAAAARELGPHGVRVVGVAPGLIGRPGLAADWPDGLASWSQASALRRPVSAEEVAATIAFLAGEGGSGITGTTVVVDAGWSAGPGW